MSSQHTYVYIQLKFDFKIFWNKNELSACVCDKNLEKSRKLNWNNNNKTTKLNKYMYICFEFFW
jgi:hypothetical protein